MGVIVELVTVPPSKALRVECTSCKTGVTIRPPFGTLIKCPECQQRWLGDDVKNVEMLFDALVRKLDDGETSRIRIEFED